MPNLSSETKNVDTGSSSSLSSSIPIIGGIIDWFTNQNNASVQRHQALEDRDFENEYNLPKNQYRRYIESGMSPALAMQAVSGVDSLSSPTAQTQQPNPSNLAGAADSASHLMIDERLADAEIDKMQAEADLLRNQSNRISTLLPHEVSKIEAEVKKDNSIADLNVKQKEMTDYLLGKYQRFETAEYDEIVERINNLVSLTELNKEKINTEVSQQTANYAAAEANVTQANLNDQFINESEQRVSESKERKKHVEYLNSLEQWKLEFRNLTGANPDDPLNKWFLEASARGDAEAMRIWSAVADFGDRANLFAKDYLKRHPMQSIYLGSRLYNQWANDRLDRFGKFTGSVGNLIPFSRGSVVAPSGSSMGRVAPNRYFNGHR